MTRKIADKLCDLVQTIRALPVQTQEALLDEFADRLSAFTDAGLSDAQRAEVDRRLANPRHADSGRVQGFFARFGVRS